jgi:ABC-type sugar transport system ATPase subunit
LLTVTALNTEYQTPQGAVRAAQDVSFEVPAGKFFTLLGPSGCGKTTTLRSIAGLERPVGGEITVNDKTVFSVAKRIFVPPYRRNFGMVFQSYAIWPHMTVFANAAFPLKMRKNKPSQGEIRDKVMRVLTAVALEKFADRDATTLSGGQQQRLALARALVMEPELLLLDEPLSNLDAKLRVRLRFELKRIQQEVGLTTIYVTHDQTEAMSMADQVILMRGGRIEQNGKPSELYEQPASLFAARFVGGSPMNLIHLDNDASGTRAVIAGHDEVAILPRPGRGLVLGLRPEDIDIAGGAGAADGPADHAIRATANVEEIEYLGADALVTCRLDDHRLTARTRGTTAPSIGDSIRIGWRESAMHVFDAESGRRLDPVGAKRDGHAPYANKDNRKIRETSI